MEATQKKPFKLNKKRLSLTLMAIPFVVFVFMFSYVPLHGWIYSLYEYRPGIPLFKNRFIGLDNFAYILKDMNNIRRVLGNTFTFYGLGLLTSVIPVILAILLPNADPGVSGNWCRRRRRCLTLSRGLSCFRWLITSLIRKAC